MSVAPPDAGGLLAQASFGATGLPPIAANAGPSSAGASSNPISGYIDVSTGGNMIWIALAALALGAAYVGGSWLKNR